MYIRQYKIYHSATTSCAMTMRTFAEIVDGQKSLSKHLSIKGVDTGQEITYRTCNFEAVGTTSRKADKPTEVLSV